MSHVGTANLRLVVKVRCESKEDGWVCEVDVDGQGETTHHTVTVSRSALESWGRGGTAQDLVSRSFEFLLERERPRSILPRFDLSVIQSYFPEYDRIFRSKA